MGRRRLHWCWKGFSGGFIGKAVKLTITSKMAVRMWAWLLLWLIMRIVMPIFHYGIGRRGKCSIGLVQSLMMMIVLVVVGISTVGTGSLGGLAFKKHTC